MRLFLFVLEPSLGRFVCAHFLPGGRDLAHFLTDIFSLTSEK